MSPLDLPRGYRFRPGPTFNASEGILGIEATDQARENISDVISSFLFIEGQVKQIIYHCVLNEVVKHRDDVIEFFLDSDWLNFNAKVHILSKILKKHTQISNSEREDIEKTLRKLMKYRNALAHGEIFWNSGQISLKYFESGSKIATLDSEYWHELEMNFQKGLSQLHKLENILSIFPPPRT